MTLTQKQQSALNVLALLAIAALIFFMIIAPFDSYYRANTAYLFCKNT